MEQWLGANRGFLTGSGRHFFSGKFQLGGGLRTFAIEHDHHQAANKTAPSIQVVGKSHTTGMSEFNYWGGVGTQEGEKLLLKQGDVYPLRLAGCEISAKRAFIPDSAKESGGYV